MQAGVEEIEVRQAVGQPERNAVARLYSQFPQTACGAQAAVEQLRVGDGFIAGMDSRIRRLLGSVPQVFDRSHVGFPLNRD